MRNKNRFLAVWLSAAMAMSMSTPVLASETAEPAVNGSSLETQKPEEAAEAAVSESALVTKTAEAENEAVETEKKEKDTEEKAVDESSAKPEAESPKEEKNPSEKSAPAETGNGSETKAETEAAVASVTLQYRKDDAVLPIPSNHTVTLTEGDSSAYAVDAQILPSEAAGQTKSYHSDAEGVVSVNSQGKLTLKSAGTAHVWATAGGVSSEKLTIVVKSEKKDSTPAPDTEKTQPLLQAASGRAEKALKQNQDPTAFAGDEEQSVSFSAVSDASGNSGSQNGSDAYSDEIGTTTEPDGEYDSAGFEKKAGGMHKGTGISAVNVRIKDGHAFATITYRSSSPATHFYIGYVKGAENNKVYNPETGTAGVNCYAAEDVGTETIGSKTYHLSRATVPVPIGTSFHFSVRVPGVMSASSVWVTYEYTITVDESKRTPLPDEKTGTDDPAAGTDEGTAEPWTVKNTAKMFTVTGASMSGTGSERKLTISLSGTGYKYLYKGSTKDAASSRASSRIAYYDKNGVYTFDIPVSDQESTFDLAALSNKQQKWYSRKLTLDWANKTVTAASGDGKTISDTKMAGVSFAATDQSGNPVSGASFTVTGSDGTAVSAETDGSFTLRDGAKYTVTVTADGYKPQTLEYTVNGDAVVPVKLTADKTASNQWTVVNNFKMFRVTSAFVTGSGSNRTLLITLGGTGYKYLYKGSTSEASTSRVSSRIRFFADSDGKYEFSIPVTASENTVKLAALSDREQKWFGRKLTLDWNTKTITADHSDDPTIADNPSPEENSGNTQGGNAGDGRTQTGGRNSGQTSGQSREQTDGRGKDTSAKGSTSGSASVSGYTFSWSGGSGRARISCLNVFEKNGQLYATIHFSQTSGGTSSYSQVRSLGQTVSGSNTFTIPVNKNANTSIEALTTAMSTPHWISYTLYVGTKDGSSAGASLSENTTKFDETAPAITGLTAKGEVAVNYSDYVRIFSYDDDIYLIEINEVSDTARENEEDSANKDADDSAKTAADESAKNSGSDADTADDAENGTAQAQDGAAQAGTSDVEESPAADNSTTDVYQQDIVKYLVVPEGIEVPAGLDKETVIIRQPVGNAYVASAEALDVLDQIGSIGAVRMLGIKAEDVRVDSVKKRMEKDYTKEDAVTYAGASDDWDLKTLLKQKADLAVLSSNLLPKKAEDLDAFNKLYSKEIDEAAELNMPLIIDRSADEKNDLAKAEWLKVYGVIFGNYDSGLKLYNQVVSKATAQEKKAAIASLNTKNHTDSTEDADQKK